MGTTVTAVAGKDEAGDLGFVGDAYEIVDLFARYRFSERAAPTWRSTTYSTASTRNTSTAARAPVSTRRLSVTFEF